METTEMVLNNGSRLQIFGLGTWLLVDKEKATLAINSALEIGIRHFDTAYIYGNESNLGEVLSEWISSGKVKREELYIVTKLPLFAMCPTRVTEYMDKSLANLKLQYVDLYLVHEPFGIQFGTEDDPILMKDGEVINDIGSNLEEVWKAMESLVVSGKTRSIGISNFDGHQIERIFKVAEIKPAVLQVEAHPYFQQMELRAVCKQFGMAFVAYSPLGSPGRKEFYESVGIGFNGNDLLLEPTIVKIATKCGKSTSQICLRFLIQEGVGVIPKSESPERIRENFDIFNFALDDTDMEDIRGLDKGPRGRVIDFKFLPGVEKHPEFPKDMLPVESNGMA